MPTRRKRPRYPSYWIQAVLFNALLMLIPLLAADTIKSAFSTNALSDEPTIESLEATRESIDAAFRSLASSKVERKEYWTNQIDKYLAQKNVAAAEGFLLAAPIILERNDALAIEAAASEKRSGTEDERLADSALLFLQDDIRAKFEAAKAPVMVLRSASADTQETPADAIEDEINPEDDEQDTSEVPAASARAIGVLGTFSDLGDNSKPWLNNEMSDSNILKITGLALIENERADAEASAFYEAASVLKSAYRARRLTEEYSSRLANQLEAALPDEELKLSLEEGLSGLATKDVREQRVRDAYSASIDEDGLERLRGSFRQINRISELTSQAAAVNLMEAVETPSDLTRARLVAEAGGNRAIALLGEQGDAVLRHAKAGVEWSTRLSLQVMSLVGAGLILLFLPWSTARRIFPRVIRPHPPEVFWGD